jgi:hypothetical protein
MNRRPEKQRGEKHWDQGRGAGRHGFGESGFSMIAIALALLATAVLTALLLGTMLNSNGAPGSGISDEQGVALATALQAQQTLSIGLTAAGTAEVNAGGYGSLQPSTLTASNPSITFVNGPSTNPQTVSMAVSDGNDSQSGGDAGGGSGLSGAESAVAAARAAAGESDAGAQGAGTGAGGGGGGGGGDAGGGSITLADRSTSGTCWLVWRSAGGGTWYGAQTGQASCTAPALASTPSPSPVSSSTIGWQMNSFPTS